MGSERLGALVRYNCFTGTRGRAVINRPGNLVAIREVAFAAPKRIGLKSHMWLSGVLRYVSALIK